MVTVRKEHWNDKAAIRDVNLRAFGQPQEADIVDKLRENCTSVLSLVAVVENRVVGHIFFSPVTIAAEGKTIEVPDEAFMILVLNEAQMQGVSGVARYRPEFSAAL
jgi:putative acetyltransferase